MISRLSFLAKLLSILDSRSSRDWVCLKRRCLLREGTFALGSTLALAKEQAEALVAEPGLGRAAQAAVLMVTLGVPPDRDPHVVVVIPQWISEVREMPRPGTSQQPKDR